MTPARRTRARRNFPVVQSGVGATSALRALLTDLNFQKGLQVGRSGSGPRPGPVRVLPCCSLHLATPVPGADVDGQPCVRFR